MNKELLRPLDIAVYKGRFGRERTGILLEIFSQYHIITFEGRQFKMKSIDEVTLSGVFRNWAYDNSYDLFDQQSSIFAHYTSKNKNMHKLLRGINKKSDVGIVATYLLTAGFITYPSAFIDTKIKTKKLLSKEYGYNEVELT